MTTGENRKSKEVQQLREQVSKDPVAGACVPQRACCQSHWRHLALFGVKFLFSEDESVKIFSFSKAKYSLQLRQLVEKELYSAFFS